MVHSHMEDSWENGWVYAVGGFNVKHVPILIKCLGCFVRNVDVVCRNFTVHFSVSRSSHC